MKECIPSIHICTSTFSSSGSPFDGPTIMVAPSSPHPLSTTTMAARIATNQKKRIAMTTHGVDLSRSKPNGRSRANPLRVRQYKGICFRGRTKNGNQHVEDKKLTPRSPPWREELFYVAGSLACLWLLLLLLLLLLAVAAGAACPSFHLCVPQLSPLHPLTFPSTCPNFAFCVP